MKVRLLGILTAVDAAGPEMDQGALMRWLNETMWFPAVWATDALTWEPIDEERARAHVMVAGHGAEAEFQFDPEGRLVNFHADRCRSVEDGFVMTPWSTPLTDHQRFGTVELPSAGSGVWTVEDGDFEYVQITVLDVDYSSSDA